MDDVLFEFFSFTIPSECWKRRRTEGIVNVNSGTMTVSPTGQ